MTSSLTSAEALVNVASDFSRRVALGGNGMEESELRLTPRIVAVVVVVVKPPGTKALGGLVEAVVGLGNTVTGVLRRMPVCLCISQLPVCSK